MSIPLLSTLIFFPILGGLSLLIVPRQQTATIRIMALIIGLIEFLLCLPLFLLFDKTTYVMQFQEFHPWITTLNINYALGIDGISVLFLLLTALIIVLSILVSWESITTKVQEFFVALLLLEGAMMGVFCATDFFLFYIFWEAMLIPMFLIIGIWGGPNRIYATVKFFLYTLVGSLLMLVGIILLYQNGGQTFDIIKLAGHPIRSNCSLFSSGPFSPPLQSRSRCGRSTPGCPTPIPRPRPPVRSSSPGC
jgi:NADH-quinone oxidoreductase subunit M